jgi:hypothetical protein
MYGGDWSDSRPRPFYSLEKKSPLELNKGVVDPRACLDVLPLPGIEPWFLRCPARGLVTILTGVQ